MTSSVPRIEIFLRWKVNRTFEFKGGADKNPVSMTELQMTAMVDGLRTAVADGLGGKEGYAAMAELLILLIKQAKADEEGRWVSANNDPIKG